MPEVRVIPCIDLMGGKVVQLVKGEKKALELDHPDEAIEMFQSFPLLHIIDLDAALGQGDNEPLIRYLLTKVNARVGGGVRSVEKAKTLLDLGAEQVIVGTAAFSGTAANVEFLSGLDPEKLVVAIDVKGGHVAIKGWQSTIDLSPEQAIAGLEPYCNGFLCTYVDAEGMMQGTNLPFFLDLKSKTKRNLIAAGGITTMDEVRTLTSAGIQVALGMAIYTGKLPLAELSSL